MKRGFCDCNIWPKKDTYRTISRLSLDEYGTSDIAAFRKSNSGRRSSCLVHVLWAQLLGSNCGLVERDRVVVVMEGTFDLLLFAFREPGSPQSGAAKHHSTRKITVLMIIYSFSLQFKPRILRRDLCAT